VDCHAGARKIFYLVKYDIGLGVCCDYPEMCNEVKEIGGGTCP
jgi:hypothetical protein